MLTLQHNIGAEVQLLASRTSPLCYENLCKLLLSRDGTAQFCRFAVNNHAAIAVFAFRFKDEIRTLPQLVAMISRLCTSKVFLNALLYADPSLLGVIITASAQGSYREEYKRLAVQVLSNELPASVPFPTSAINFFLKVASEATKDSPLEGLFKLHSLLWGACANLPQQLPRDTVARLIEGARPTVSNASTVAEQQPTLIRLAILAHLDPAGVEGQDNAKQSSTTSKYFSGKGVERVLGLAVIQACWHSKPSHSPCQKTACQSLDAAIDVLERIGQKARIEWASSENGLVNVGRICKTLHDIEKGHPDLILRLRAILALLSPQNDCDIPVPFEELDLEQNGTLRSCTIVSRTVPGGKHGINQFCIDMVNLRAEDRAEWIKLLMKREEESRILSEQQHNARREMDSRLTAQAEELAHLHKQEQQRSEKLDALSKRNVELERQNASLETAIKLQQKRVEELAAQSVQASERNQRATDENLILSKQLIEEQHVLSSKEKELAYEKTRCEEKMREMAQTSKAEMENRRRCWETELEQSLTSIREEHKTELAASSAHAQEMINALRNDHEDKQKRWNATIESLRNDHEDEQKRLNITVESLRNDYDANAASIQKDLENTEAALNEAREQNSELENHMKKDIHFYNTAIQALKQEHQEKITQLEAKIIEAQHGYEEGIQSLEQQLREREVRGIELTEDLENLNLVMRSQEDLIESLKAIRGVSYYAGQRDYVQRPAPLPKMDQSSMLVPATASRSGAERRDAANEGLGAVETTSDIPITTSFSSSISGPTPKRLRAQRSSRPRHAAAQDQRTENPNHSPEKSRVPLSDISSGNGPNWSPTKQQSRSPPKWTKPVLVPRNTSPVKPSSQANRAVTIARRRSCAPLKPVEAEQGKRHRLTFDPMAFGTPFGFGAVPEGGDTQMDEKPLN